MARVPDMYFLAASGPEPVRSLQESLSTERILWTGRCAVAEYAFDEPASLPRWTLPEETGVVVTETRVVFIDPAGPTGGELHWLWPQHVRVQPGNRDTGRSATVTQIQLVCNGPGGTFPALVLAGGDLATVGDADRLANALRQSIARFRVEHANELGLTAPQARMLSRLVIGPEFNNFQGGEGQTVTLLGSITVQEPVNAGATGPAVEAEHGSRSSWEQEPFLGEYLPEQGQAYAGYAPSPAPAEYSPHTDFAPHAEPQPYADFEPARPELTPRADFPPARPELTPHADLAPSHAEQPQPQPQPRAEFEPHPYSGYAPPQPMPAPHPLPSVRAPEPQYTDLASRAADLAARVASLVSANAGAEQSLERYETQTTNLSSFLAEGDDGYPAQERAEAVRRTAARFAGNSARGRATGQRPAADDQPTRPRNA